MKKETVIDFCGFYETWASSKIDEAIFSYWMCKNVKDQNKQEYTDLTEKQKEKWDDFSMSDKYYKLADDYKKDYILQYTKLYFSELQDVTGVKIEVTSEDVSLHSPQYYNFTTDRIFVKVDADKLMELYKKLDLVKFAEKIKEKFTSYDGFSSYYDNSIDGEDWADVEKFDHNQWLTVLETFLDDEEIIDNLHSEIYI